MDILQKLLSAGLITAQTDDELVKIEKSISAVSKLISSRPADYVTALLLSPGVESEHGKALLDDVFTLVQKEWRTLSARYPGFPTELLKAILLCALVKLANEDTRFADALGLSLPIVGRHLDGRDALIDVWQSMVSEFQHEYETRAEKRWSVPSAIEVSNIALPDEASRAITSAQEGVSAATLSKLLLPAFASQTPDGSETFDNGNTFAHNQMPQWGQHAANRLGSVLASRFAKAMAVEIEGPDVEQMASAISDYVKNISSQVVEAVSGQDLRTRLLWWKESRYSPTARQLWDNMSPQQKALRSVVDLASWLPDATPPSAFHFARSALAFEDEKALSLVDWIDQARDVPLANLYSPPTSEWSGRLLIEILDANSDATIDEYPFGKTTKLTPNELVDDLLREILSLRTLGSIKQIRKPRV